MFYFVLLLLLECNYIPMPSICCSCDGILFSKLFTFIVPILLTFSNKHLLYILRGYCIDGADYSWDLWSTLVCSYTRKARVLFIEIAFGAVNNNITESSAPDIWDLPHQQLYIKLKCAFVV